MLTHMVKIMLLWVQEDSKIRDKISLHKITQEWQWDQVATNKCMVIKWMVDTTNMELSTNDQ